MSSYPYQPQTRNTTQLTSYLTQSQSSHSCLSMQEYTKNPIQWVINAQRSYYPNPQPSKQDENEDTQSQ